MSPMLRRMGIIAGLAAVAAVVLALRFSPDWFLFIAQAREAESASADASHRHAIERAFVSGAAERGALVLDQKRDLGTTIDDPNHKALRWRLLPPAVGRMFGLSNWATLALAHLGCAGLVLFLVWLGTPQGPSTGFGGLWLALTAGATAPVITSLGWLGYYDSLLAIGLLAIAFAQPRGIVAVACLLTPWIDERFVLALPLALLLRWLQSGQRDLKSWLQREAAFPLLATLVFALVRLALGGTGGSQTVEGYVRTFIFGQEVTAADRFFGVWSGLRIGWLVLAAGTAAGYDLTRGGGKSRCGTLVGVALATVTLGALSAQDTARATVLIFPVIPWAWLAAAQQWPKIWKWAGPLLALLAVITPAHQVFGRIRTPVPPRADRPADQPLVRAQNNLGYLHDRGEVGTRDVAEAKKWYARAAEAGLAEAQFNLAMVILRSETADRETPVVERWLEAAARQGLNPARRTLATLYTGSHGFEKNLPRAWAWLSLSDAPPDTIKTLFGQLTPADQSEALRIKAALTEPKAPSDGD